MTHRAVFTHNDLDGLTSALLTRLALPDADVYFCEYSGLAELVRRRIDRYDVVWFTDLSIRDEAFFIDLRAADCECYWFDHHASSTPQSWMAECRIDVSGHLCAAEVVRDYLVEQGVDIPMPLQTLVEWTHDADLWVRAVPEAQEFNDILGKMQLQELFDLLTADAGRVYDWTDSMREAAAATQHEREWSRELAEATSVWGELEDGKRVRAACCWGSVSEVGDDLGDPDTLVVLFDLRAIERGQAKYSFRTQSKEIESNRIAELLGGGGHPQASGAPLELGVLGALAAELLTRVQAAAAEVGGRTECA